MKKHSTRAWVGVCAGVLLLAIGCGKSDSNLPNLTDAQKAQFQNTLKSVGRSTGAVQQAGGHAAPKALGATADTSQQQMAASLQQAVTSGQCTITANVPDLSAPRAQSGSQTVTVKAGGAACPVVMDLTATVTWNGDLLMDAVAETQISISATYAVQDATFKKYNDVTAFQISGTISAKKTPTSFAASASIKGTVHSESLGNLPFSVTGTIAATQGSAEGQIAISVQYSDHVAQLRAQVASDNGRAQLKYYLNNEEISQQQFSQYLSDTLGPQQQLPVSGMKAGLLQLNH